MPNLTFKYGGSRRSYGTVKRKYGAKRVTKKGVKKAVRQYTDKVFSNKVKTVMSKAMEVKQSGIRGIFNCVNYYGTNGGLCETTNIMPFDPIISQGTGESNRIGNKISIVSCKHRYMITLLPYNTQLQNNAPSPVYVRFIWFYDRADNNNLPTVYTNANFIDNGNSSQQFLGNLSDIFYRYNTDRYRIMGVRDYKMGFASNSGSGGEPSYQYFANNDSQMIVNDTVDCTKWVIKKQTFNDNLGTAENRKLYCLVLCYAQSGGNWNSALPNSIQVRYEINYKYTDA